VATRIAPKTAIINENIKLPTTFLLKLEF